MPKRKKHPRLPNGFGSIKYLGKGRSNPYAVYPPADRMNDKGNYLHPKALCYVDDWYVAFAVLNSWRAGTYKPGDEILIGTYRDQSTADLDAFCARIIADYSSQQHLITIEKEDNKTFSEVYEEFYKWKYEEAEKQLSKQSRNSARAAYKNSSCLHDKIFKELRLKDFQDCVNSCIKREKPLKESSLELVISLLHQMSKYALLHDISEKDYTIGLYMPDAEKDESGTPLTPEELKILWSDADNPVSELAIIMCYSGWRIDETTHLDVDLERQCYTGGNKTKSGKSRIVPIHPLVLPLVRRRMDEYGTLLSTTPDSYRSKFHARMKLLGISGKPKHTPHDCRHTFSALCERYHVAENDRKRMMGHSFGNDITNSVYGHRTLDDLRREIEKIQKEF